MTPSRIIILAAALFAATSSLATAADQQRIQHEREWLSSAEDAAMDVCMNHKMDNETKAQAICDRFGLCSLRPSCVTAVKRWRIAEQNRLAADPDQYFYEMERNTYRR